MSQEVGAAPREGEELVTDYATLSLSLGRHPLCLLRRFLEKWRYMKALALRSLTHNCPARCAGIVTGRQRRELLSSRLLGVLGVLQREGEVVHLIAKRLVDHSELLGRLPTSSRNFH